MNEATARILEFIGRIRPAYARMLRCEIARMTEDGQDDRVMQALAAIRPTEAKQPEGMSLTPQVGEKVLEAAIARVLAFIYRVAPAYAASLEARIVSLSKEEQLNILTFALTTLEVPGAKARATATRSAEDRKLLDAASSAMDRFWAQQGKPK